MKLILLKQTEILKKLEEIVGKEFDAGVGLILAIRVHHLLDASTQVHGAGLAGADFLRSQVHRDAGVHIR